MIFHGKDEDELIQSFGTHLVLVTVALIPCELRIGHFCISFFSQERSAKSDFGRVKRECIFYHPRKTKQRRASLPVWYTYPSWWVLVRKIEKIPFCWSLACLSFIDFTNELNKCLIAWSLVGSTRKVSPDLERRSAYDYRLASQILLFRIE